jgi:hypothetical protein
MNDSSMSCKYISASVPEIGDPIAIPFLGLKNWLLYWKYFCSIITFRSCITCYFIFLFMLFLSNQKIVDWIILCFGKLTYRSLISNVIILWFSVIWILFSLCAISYEFTVAYVLGRFIYSFIQEFGYFIWGCLHIVCYRSDWFIFFVRFYVCIDSWYSWFYI